MVLIAMGAILVAAGLLAAGEYVATQQPTTAAAAGAQTDAEAYTGSILYLPHDGRTCRQLFFDNLTGRFTDNGSVECSGAAYDSGIGSPKQLSAARARVIASGFREH
jgi:hypothetical protein